MLSEDVTRYGRDAMSRSFPESDWRIFRELRPRALERLCELVLNEISTVSGEPSKTFHERYLAIYELVARRNEDVARTFDNPRRSQEFFQLAAMKSFGLLKPEELSRFSRDTLEIIGKLTEVNEPE